MRRAAVNRGPQPATRFLTKRPWRLRSACGAVVFLLPSSRPGGPLPRSRLRTLSWSRRPPRASAAGWFECTRDANGKITPTGSNANTVIQFGKYAEYLLATYGDKVKTWATFNEAWTFTFLGSGYGKAPSIQPYMDNDIWPYVAGHNVILAHLAAAKVFRAMQASGKLTKEHQLGITNNQDWREPYTHAPQDIAAAQAALEGQLAWYCDPIYAIPS